MTQLVSVTARGLLDAWERAQGAAPVLRPLLVLEAVTHEDAAALAALPLGVRDRLLLDLRRSALGERMACEAHCPACAEHIEFDVSTPALTCDAASAAEQRFEIEHEGWRIVFRVPTTADLIGCAGQGDDVARRIALECVQEARWSSVEVARETLPDAALEAVGERCAALDPQADIELDLTCPACGHGWRSPFDIAAFLWSEIEAWAVRMLGEIHVIASGYGWSEADILNLSPSRRRYYLERLEA
ncbi:MAG: hypothetical protein JNK68_02680 [Betaproteobacteria bacterium]|nr:hypothetical protein [Betaproteobacteria bacterium]